MSGANGKGEIRPLQVVTTCARQDLPVLLLGVPKLFENLNVETLFVICPTRDRSQIAGSLRSAAVVIPEDEFLPGMTSHALRSYGGHIPPKEIGWYFQQFLKLQFSYVDPEKDYYLIWDADTIPVRPLKFFNPHGQMLLTKAREYHLPYFETYKRILHEEPNRLFSFIAQHMLIQKSVAREMLEKIAALSPDERNWAWAILASFPAHGPSLFSEYETYGNYIKNHYPERVEFIERKWSRKGAVYTSGWVPNEGQLQQFRLQFEYVSFERVSRTWPEFCLARLKGLWHHHSTNDTTEDY